MLTQNELSRIKEHLENAQNPLFFYDNDQDGICSFAILRRFCGKGKGVAIKTFPELQETYFRKVEEFDSDYIFVLDKPSISEDFLERVRERNLPLVWIDHHEIDFKSIPSFVEYFNPLKTSKSSEPVTVICQEVCNREEDLWLAVVGAISDRFFPDYYFKFRKKFPELTLNSKDAFEIFYESEIGKISQIIGFALKDTITNVVFLSNFLVRSSSPYDFLEENSKNAPIYKKYFEVREKLSKLVSKASACVFGEILFFKYSGSMSLSSDVANKLSYLFPDKLIVVVYLSMSKANISVRGKNAKKIVLAAIEGFENATGGGHEEAVGAKINLGDLDLFEKRILNTLIF